MPKKTQLAYMYRTFGEDLRYLAQFKHIKQDSEVECGVTN
jgi:hypothetical protein